MEFASDKTRPLLPADVQSMTPEARETPKVREPCPHNDSLGQFLTDMYKEARSDVESTVKFCNTRLFMCIFMFTFFMVLMVVCAIVDTHGARRLDNVERESVNITHTKSNVTANVTATNCAQPNGLLVYLILMGGQLVATAFISICMVKSPSDNAIEALGRLHAWKYGTLISFGENFIFAMTLFMEWGLTGATVENVVLLCFLLVAMVLHALGYRYAHRLAAQNSISSREFDMDTDIVHWLDPKYTSNGVVRV